ncbi:MAG TPA: FkbM family methyltransferase [Stellaceae bacterium]|nr:FkbM family methyltransferase [Stellaceae bacterium]
MADDTEDASRREIEDAVTALYRTLLLRDPDAPSLKGYGSSLLRGQLTVPSLVERICRSQEFAANLGKFAAHYGGPRAVRFTNDASQHGEVGLLIREIVNRSCPHRIVVDVGVLGRIGSNSYDLLHWFGWKGLLIEANPHLVAKIREEFAGLDIELVTCAVSDYAGAATLYLGSNDGISSLRRQATARWGAIRGEVEVPVRRLGELLAEHDIPRDFDLLSLDVEGEDIKVMNDLIGNSRFRPRWVIIEASYDFTTKSLSELPLIRSVVETYEIFGQTKANLLLRRRDVQP